jgi:alginate O-acetyltransferase complex protein AlgJ
MSGGNPSIRKAANLALVGVLAAMLAAPSLCTVLGLRLAAPVNDFRATAPPPVLSWDRAALEALPGRFEAWYNDHFGLRSVLIRGLHLIKGRWLGVSTAPHVLLGLHGWLFYTERQPGTDYHSTRVFTEEELQRWGRILEKRRAWLARQGIRYVVFIPPDKQTVYPEHLPAPLCPRHAESRLDQLAAYLHRHTQVTLLDIRPELRASKEEKLLYHVTDSHWNSHGAYLGYRALVGLLSRWLPTGEPDALERFVPAIQDGPGDLAEMIAQARLRREDAVFLERLSTPRARLSEAPPAPLDNFATFGPPRAWECDDTSLPRAVMFHDSFFLALHPYISEHFRRLVCAWSDQFSPDLVRREQPDVVIQEIVERKLNYVTPDDFDDSQP